MLLAPALARAAQTDIAVQYSRFEQPVFRVNPDGSYRKSILTTESWLQTVTVRGSARPRPSLALSSEVRWSDQYTIGGNYRTQAPYGRLQLIHPVFGLSGSFQPERTTTTFGGYGDSRFVPLTLDGRSDRLSLSGYFAKQGIPRLTAQWDRRHQSRNVLDPESREVSRQVGLSHVLGPVSMSANYRDKARGFNDGSLRPPNSKSYDFQAGTSATPRPNMALGLGYSYIGSRVGLDALDPGRFASHSVSVSGAFHQSSKVDWGLGYGFRHSGNGTRTATIFNDHNGNLTFSYRPISIASIAASGGLSSSGSRNFSTVAKSLSTVGTIEAPVRRGWRASATASRSLAWQARLRGVAQDAVGAGTQMDLGHHMSLNGAWQLNSNGDPGAGDARVGIQSNLSLAARPLSSVNFSLNEQRSRVGPAWNHPVSLSRSRSVNAGVRSGRRFDLQAALSQYVNTPGPRRADIGQRYTANWHPGELLQFSGQYSKGGAVATKSRQQGHLNLYGSLNAKPLPNLTAQAGFSISSAGEGHQTRSFSAIVTRVFGR